MQLIVTSFTHLRQIFHFVGRQKKKKKTTHKRYVIIWYFVRIVCFIMMTAAGQPFYICEVLSYFSWSHLILRVGLTCLLPTSQVKKIEASKKWQSCPPRSSESTWNPMLQFPVHGCCKKKSTSWKYFIQLLHKPPLQTFKRTVT